MEFTYHVLRLPGPLDNPNYVIELNRWGREGWEVIHIERDGNDLLHLLKREDTVSFTLSLSDLPKPDLAAAADTVLS